MSKLYVREYFSQLTGTSEVLAFSCVLDVQNYTKHRFTQIGMSNMRFFDLLYCDSELS